MGNCQKTSDYFKNMDLTTINCYDIQFTRYLYEKDEVKLTLITSILNKKEDSVFWAYELYYSGFITELVELLMNIYYDFYASLNQSFESYLYKKIKILSDSTSEHGELLSVIVNNFMIRPHTVDVFFMRKMSKELSFVMLFVKNYHKTFDFKIVKTELTQLLEIEDYLSIARLIFYDIYTDHLPNILEVFVDHFIEKGLTLKKKRILQDYFEKTNVEFSIIKSMLFSRLIHFASLLKNVKMGKNLYVHIESEDVVMYETIEADLHEKGNGNKSAILPAYRILSIATLYAIDEDNYLSLFQLKRESLDIVEAYQNHWLYHASFSPLWKQRIKLFHGVINNKKKTVDFKNDDDIEYFYELYGLEPDEQTTEIQNKILSPIVKKRSWFEFYLQHKNRGIIDIDNHYFDNIEKMKY